VGLLMTLVDLKEWWVENVRVSRNYPFALFYLLTFGFLHLAKEMQGWKQSWYNALDSERATLVNRQYVLDVLDGIENFKFCHLKSAVVDLG